VPAGGSPVVSVLPSAFGSVLSAESGSVVLSLPHDVLPLASNSPDAPFVEALETGPGDAQMAALEELLAQSERPMLILGGKDDYFHDDDEWTLRSANGRRAAHSEHTVAITKDGPVILTLP